MQAGTGAAAAEPKSALILSYHDFRATKNLEADAWKRCVPISADFYKIVSTATTLYDNVTMMKFLEKYGDRHSLVGLCMGEQGIISRLLGVRAGSVFTFAAVSPDEKTAPGQITAQELRNTYRIEQVDVATRVYGVVGRSGGAFTLAGHHERGPAAGKCERCLPRRCMPRR